MGIPRSRRKFLRLSGVIVVSATGCLFAEKDVPDFLLDNSQDQDAVLNSGLIGRCH